MVPLSREVLSWRSSPIPGRDRLPTPVFLGFPGGSDGKECACNVGHLGLEDPLEEGMATHSSILAWRIALDRGAWQVIVPRVVKSQTQLSIAQHRLLEKSDLLN